MTQTILETPPTIATIPYYSGPIPTNPLSADALYSKINESNLQTVSIQDVRPNFSSFTIDKNGFQIIKHSSALNSPPYNHSSWNDALLREKIYHREMETLLKDITGAKKVMIILESARTAPHKEPSDVKKELEAAAAKTAPANSSTNTNDDSKRINLYTKFTSAKGFDKGTEQRPAPKPHIDIGPSGARATLRNWDHAIVEEAKDIIAAEDTASLLPGGISKNYKGRRYAMFAAWRPLKPIKRDPLAFVEANSYSQEDIEPYCPTLQGINGPYELEIKLLKEGKNGGHKWYWVSEQQTDEVTLLKFFDSKSEREGSGVAGGVPHVAFHLEGTEDEEARESIETKFIAFW